MWAFIFLGVTLLSIFSIFYLSREISNFKFLDKYKNKHKISIIILAIIIIVLLLFFSLWNVMTIIIHYLIISLVFKLIFKFIKKDFKYNLKGILVLLFTTSFLVYGYINAHYVVETNYCLNSKKINDFKIAVISDSHIGTTNNSETLKSEFAKIEKNNIDVLLIAGDFVDDSTSREDMIKTIEYLGKVKTKYGIYFAHGNHDKGYYGSNRGFSKEDLELELMNNNIKVLIDESVLINDELYIIGRKDAEDKTRKSIQNLVKDLDISKYMVVIDHQPVDYKNEEDSNVDLVISGHTHGGQLFPLNIVSDVFKFNDKVYGLENRNKTSFIVTSGISAWEIQFRTITNQEYVIIDLNNKC